MERSLKESKRVMTEDQANINQLGDSRKENTDNSVLETASSAPYHANKLLRAFCRIYTANKCVILINLGAWIV